MGKNGLPVVMLIPASVAMCTGHLVFGSIALIAAVLLAIAARTVDGSIKVDELNEKLARQRRRT